MKRLTIKDYEIDINLSSFINIIGLPGSGKTWLLKMLINQIHNPNIYLDGKSVDSYDINFKKCNITACFSPLEFNTSYVKEELLFYLGKCGYDVKTSFDNLDKFIEFFELGDLIDQKLESLTIYEQALIKILSLLIINPAILGIDNLFSYLDNKPKLKIIKYAKENKITILNITTNSEELLLGTDIIVLENHKVKAYDKTSVILKDEKLLLSVGFNLPFIISLNNGLEYYEVLKEKYCDFKTLIGAIWK